MLDRSSDSVGLDTAHISRCNLARKDRILGEILEITAAERVSMDIHSRGQEHIDSIFKNLVSHGCGDFLDKVDVP